MADLTKPREYSIRALQSAVRGPSMSTSARGSSAAGRSSAAARSAAAYLSASVWRLPAAGSASLGVEWPYAGASASGEE
jgi:hypothetical protein